MNNNNTHFEGSFSVSGTPFDPFSRDDRPERMNARIMPSVFIQPDSPVKFTLLRNTVPYENDDSYFGFF